MSFLALVRFYLRRYRLLFGVILVLVMLHELGFLFVFQFWKRNLELSDLIVGLIPRWAREGIGIPLTDLTDPRTYKALIYMRPDLRALTLVFGVTVGTDVIAGEVGRGSADVLYSHPVRRATAVLAALSVVALHLLCIGVVMLVGYAIGSTLFPMPDDAPGVAQLVPAVTDIVLASVVITTTSFLAGSFAANRPRAVAYSLLLIAVPIVLSFLGLFEKNFERVAQLFPEHYYRPHILIAGGNALTLWECAWPLLLIGGVCVGGAIVLAQRRDLA